VLNATPCFFEINVDLVGRYKKKMKKCALLLAIIFGWLQPLTVHAQKTVTVAIAANMQFAMEQLKVEFEKETGIKVELITSSSGKLSAQIAEGAPYDVFVSADMKYPQDLYDKGFATGTPKVYAIGQLVLWTSKPGLKPTADLKQLLSPAIKKIAVANPKTAPYGVAAEETLKYYKLYDGLKDKLVYGESIGQTQQFIETQAADIGFIAKSQVLAAEMKGRGAWVEIPGNAYTPIRQGAVILKHGKDTNNAAAGTFYAYIFSDAAQQIFKKFGYIVN
jgi:molybdate transport system substrate-binding protein